VKKAVELLHHAAELGSAEAYYHLGVFHEAGINGVIRDEIKAKQYYEKGAMAGCVFSRFKLGCFDDIAGRFDRAVKHWLIGASGGDIRAVNPIRGAMTRGYATKDDYAQALRGYQQYLEEARSDERDRAAAYSNAYKYLFEAKDDQPRMMLFTP
jgi:TPR repeat protein